MTPVERALSVLGHLWGDQLSRRIRDNLPSRKPHLWQRLPQSVIRRAQLAWRTRFDSEWAKHDLTVQLPEFGMVMELSPPNYFIGLPLFVFGVYEISGTRFLQTLLRPGMTFVDVGANSGYYSLIAARLVG